MQKSIRKKDLSLFRYNISLYAYRELEYFCLQYREKKSMINHLLVNGNETYKGEKAILENDIKMIETAALEADRNIYSSILKNVTDGTIYEHLDVPYGRRQFYEIRRVFFFNLYKKRNLITRSEEN